MDRLFSDETRKRTTNYPIEERASPRSLEYTPEKRDSDSLLDKDFGFVETDYSPEFVNGPTTQASPITPDINVIEEMLINNEPDKDWEASPPWAPPFDDPEKNEMYNKLPRYVQDNIVRLNVQGEDAKFYVVNEVYKKYIQQQTGVLPQSPDGSPPQRMIGPRTPEGTPPSRGEGAIIFNNSLLDSKFNELSGEQQARILGLPHTQREGVMSEIMKRSMQGGSNNVLNNEPLNDLFGRLPVHNQMVALQGGYKSMADELKTLGGQVPKSLTTVRTPIPVSVELSNKFPLLAVDQKGEEKNRDSLKSSNDDTSSSSDNNVNETVKKITF
jgi:hypothetical protein